MTERAVQLAQAARGLGRSVEVELGERAESPSAVVVRAPVVAPRAGLAQLAVPHPHVTFRRTVRRQTVIVR